MKPVGRIAILHYTAAPAIGGIENLIEAQLGALVGLGVDVRLIVGEGDKPPAAQLCRLPELHPSHPQVMCAQANMPGIVPLPDHPLVEAIRRRLQDALQGCGQCWVHNAFSVYLNPFLTVALLQLTQELPHIGWVAWSSDLSAVSAYWPSLTEGDRERLCKVQPGVAYVTISRARRAELSRLLALDEDEIRVVPPPLDTDDWLQMGSEAREIAARLNVPSAQPIILVPAKLLVHKNLELAVRVGAALQRLAPQPMVLLTGAPSPHDPEASDGVRQNLRRLVREAGATDTCYLLTDLIGKVPERKTVRDLMLLSDLVFLPSTEEGFGTPLREAAALRTPVLCSDIPPFREAAGSYAQYFSLNAAPESIALQAIQIAELPVNQTRREAIQSYRKFCLQLRELIRSRIPLTPQPHSRPRRDRPTGEAGRGGEGLTGVGNRL
jgi:mannosylglucosylglycerate synthase